MRHVPLPFQRVYECSNERSEKWDGSKISGRGEIEWKLSNFFFVDNLNWCDESEWNVRAMVGRFFEVCRRRALEVNVDKSN